MEKIIKHVTIHSVIYIFLIAENDEVSTFFCEEECCVSEIDTDNELNCPVHDARDEKKQRNQISECLWETHEQSKILLEFILCYYQLK